MKHLTKTEHIFEFTREDLEAWVTSRVLQALGPDAARIEPKLAFYWDSTSTLLKVTANEGEPE